MSTTKNKIIEVSKALFFEQGIANTRLQQIADATSISVGNLAYHYKNKEAIVDAVYENLFAELSSILSQYIIHTNLPGFDKQFSDLYHFLENNNFTFNNTWEIERNYRQIQKEWLTVNNKILLQLKKRIDAGTENGLFKPEPWNGAYELLAQNLLIIINSWLPQQMLRKKPVSEDLYKKCLWSLLYPNFTTKGALLFSQTILPAKLF